MPSQNMVNTEDVAFAAQRGSVLAGEIDGLNQALLRKIDYVLQAAKGDFANVLNETILLKQQPELRKLSAALEGESSVQGQYANAVDHQDASGATGVRNAAQGFGTASGGASPGVVNGQPVNFT